MATPMRSTYIDSMTSGKKTVGPDVSPTAIKMWYNTWTITVKTQNCVTEWFLGSMPKLRKAPTMATIIPTREIAGSGIVEIPRAASMAMISSRCAGRLAKKNAIAANRIATNTPTLFPSII